MKSAPSPSDAALLLAGARRGAAARGYRRWMGVAALIGAILTARAHDPGISTVQGEVRKTGIELTTGFAPADAVQLLPADARPPGRLEAEEFEGLRPHFEVVAPQLWEMREGGTIVAPRETRVQLLAGDNLSFRVVFPRPVGAKVTLRARQLAHLPPGHRQFVIVADEQGMTLAKKLLSAKDELLELDLTAGGTEANTPESGSGTPASWGFVWLGVEHIWKGYDHLLFLFALLIVCRTFRSIVAIVSCFTLAHSLTLALATLDLVSVPSRLVEPAIAATIVFVGAENLWRRGEEPPGRWVLTFAFGLIHGFGFASVLRELGVGSGGQGIALPLFTFNLGVEIGQIVIAAIVLPLVWRLRKNEKFVRHGVPVLSVVVAAAGLYWLLERTVLA